MDVKNAAHETGNVQYWAQSSETRKRKRSKVTGGRISCDVRMLLNLGFGKNEAAEIERHADTLESRVWTTADRVSRSVGMKLRTFQRRRSGG
jgi:hypothetical protein